MPFKSKAQRRKFYVLAAEGKMDPSVVKEFESATAGKKLPERAVKKQTTSGRFAKKAKVVR